jgi:Leucine-rich repeat (LRR) protein
MSVRALMALVLLVGGGLGWFVHNARVQRDAVAAIEADGGHVVYDRDWKDGVPQLTLNRPCYLNWLEDHVGTDYFSNVACVILDENLSDAKLALVANLPMIEELLYTPIKLFEADRPNSSLTDGGLAYLEGHTRLKELDLSDTNISDEGLVHLRSLLGLRSLYLSDTNISDEGLVHLRSLLGIRSLYLRHTLISDAGLVYLQGLTGLRKLDLSFTNISDTGVFHLKGLTSLQSLDLYGSKVDDFGAQELRRALPKARISYTHIVAR